MSKPMDIQNLLEVNYEDAVDDYGEEVVNMAYQIFVDKLYNDIKDRIPKAYQANSFQELKVIFHNFKTTSRYLGAENFSELCNQIQLCCKDGEEDVAKLKTLYPIAMSNFEKFYQKCKKKYNKIMNFDSDNGDDSTITITEVSEPVSELPSRRTPKLKSRLSIEDDELHFVHTRLNSPKKGIIEKFHDRSNSVLNLVSISLGKEEKLTNSYQTLCLKNEQNIVDKILHDFIQNINKGKNYIINLKTFIQLKQNCKIAEVINEIKNNLSILLTETFQDFLTEIIDIIQNNSQIFDPNELLKKFEKLNKELIEMYEKYCKKEPDKSKKENSPRKNMKKHHLDLREIEEISKTNLISVIDSNSNTTSNIVFSSPKPSITSRDMTRDVSETIKELNSFETLFTNSFEKKDLKGLISNLKAYKSFLSVKGYEDLEDKIENDLEKLKKCQFFEDCQINLNSLLDDLAMIRVELDECISTPSQSEIPEEEPKTILSELKPGNFRWFFTLNLDDDFEKSDEERENSFPRIKKTNSFKKQFSEEEIFNCPFKNSFSYKII